MEQGLSDQDSEDVAFDPRHRRLTAVAVAILALVTWVVMSDYDTGDEDPAQPAAIEAPVLSGTVTDEAGRPVASAQVNADDKSTSTDDEGRFSFYELSSGTYVVDADAEDHVRVDGDEAAVEVSVDDRQTTEEVDLVLQRPAKLSGRIVAGGRPVEGAQLGLSYIRAPGMDGQPVDPFAVEDIAVSEADGSFRIGGVVPGRLKLTVTHSDTHVESGVMSIDAGQRRDNVIVDLEPSGRLEGRVVDDDGQAVAAELTLMPSYSVEAPRRIQSDEDGSFSADELEEGGYRLDVDAEGFRRERIDDFYVYADEPTTVEVQMERSLGILGRVVEPDGTLIVGASVTIEHDGRTHRTETDDEGRFQFPDITSGQGTVVANSRRHDPSKPTPIEPGQEIAVQIEPGGHVIGRVLDERRHPVNHFSVTVSFLEIHGEDHHHTRSLAPVDIEDRRGRFEVGPVPTGRYQLVIERPDSTGVTSEVIDVDAGQTVGPLTIELDEPASMTGVLLDAEGGQPVENARIVHEDRTRTQNPSTRSDVDGWFRLDGLTPGIQRIRVDHADYITEIFDGVELLPGHTLTYDVELEPIGDRAPGVARNDVGAAFGSADDGATVVALIPDGPAEESGLQQGDVVTGVDGHSVGDMAVGEIVRRIRGDSAKPVTLDVDRPGRGPMQLELERRRQVTAGVR